MPTTFRTIAILALLAATAPAHADVRILEDRGGALSVYEARLQWLNATGERVIIDGPCLSACTLHLNLPPGQVCATARAVIGFHSALDRQFGLPVPATNAELMRIYPANVRDWINRRGGLGSPCSRRRGASFYQAATEGDFPCRRSLA